MRKEWIVRLRRTLGKRFSTLLGIDLSSGKEEEIFKWFLASILFGARISERIAISTFQEFEKEKILSPEKILRKGWDGLVEILDRGGYVRYDFKTATKLLEIAKNLKERYGGSLKELHQEARSSQDLERKIQELGKGVGEVTTQIFLRELRGIWSKANPLLSPLALLAAKNLGLVREGKGEEILKKLKTLTGDLVSFETALLRVGKDFCRRKECGKCMVKEYCKKGA